MTRHRAGLTARAVQHASGNGRTQRLGGGNGLYLLIAPRGSKSWLLRTVVRGKRTDIGLGSASLVSLAQAREESLRLRQIARTGGDPLAERRQAHRAIPPFEEAARRVHEAHSTTFRNAKHRQQWLSSLTPIFGAIGKKPVDAVTSADLLAALAPFWLTRQETARRVLQRIRVIFDWCKAQGFCAGDLPTHGLTRALPKQRTQQTHHAALPYGDVPAFLRALRASDAGEAVKLAFEFLILTAARSSEVLGATWDEINLDTRTWTIPGSRMKADREHRVPLSPRCVEILRYAQRLTDGGSQVFPGRHPKRPLSNMVFLMALRRMGRRDITTHGFRSSFRDWAEEQTHFPRTVCEAALAHTVRDKTEAAYRRTDLFEKRRDLMHAWDRHAIKEPARIVSIGASV